MNKVRKAIVAGFFRRLAVQRGVKNGYNPFQMKSGIGKTAFIHSSSVLSKKLPKLIIYHEIFKTENAKTTFRGVVEIETSWVKEMAPDYWRKIVKHFPELIYA